jgi:hypothetical protein
MSAAHRRTPTRPRQRLGTLLLGAALTLVLTVPTGPAAPAAADTEPVLLLVDQPFALEPDDVLELTVQFADGADLAEIVAEGTIIVTSHRPLTVRAQVAEARNGALPNVVDTIDISPRAEADTPPVADVPGAPVTAEAIVSTTGELAIRVPTESSTRSAGALQFAQPGIHPLVVEVRRGDTTEGVLVTFVDRQPTDTPAATSSDTADTALGVGLVIASDAAPVVDASGRVMLDPTARTALSSLAESLGALADALGTRSSAVLPALVHLDPTALDVLADTEPDVAADLSALLARVELTAPPLMPLDPATAAAAGQADTYRRLVDQGTALLADTVPDATPQRATTISNAPLSRAGAELITSRGAETVVLTFDEYDTLQGSIGPFTDTTRAIDIDGVGLRAVIVDPHLANLLDDPGVDVAATAVAIAAELVVLGEQIHSSSDIAGHLLLLGSTGLGPPDPELLGRIGRLLATARGVRLATPVELIDDVETASTDGTPIGVGLPDTVPPPEGYDPARRALLVDVLRADTAAISSMLPDDDPRPGRWAAAADRMVSTIVTDDLAASSDRAVRAQLDEIRRCVVPPERFSFTLTGRTSTIPIQISNLCDVPIVVRVQLDSPKITFPAGEQLEELAPGADTEVRVKAVARSNGRSSVFLRLLTPTPSGTEQALAPEVVLTARVQSLAGVGQLLLGTLVLVVLAWWLRHWRDARRQALLAANAQHHPAARSGP